MGLQKSRKPYPRSILVVEDPLGELEIENRRYKKVYKVSTLTGIQQHLTKHSKTYSPKKIHLWYRGSIDFPGVRSQTDKGDVLVVDVEVYEKLTGLQCVEPSSVEAIPPESIANLQSSFFGQIEKTRKDTEAKIDALMLVVNAQSQTIEQLSKEVEELKARLNGKNKRQELSSNYQQASLF